MKPNTVGAVLRGDPTSTRTLTAIADGFGVGVAALFDDGAPEPADHWTAALEHLDAAGRTLAAANVDATPRPELTPDAAADVERAALAVHRALEAIGEVAAEVRVGRALSPPRTPAAPRPLSPSAYAGRVAPTRAAQTGLSCSVPLRVRVLRPVPRRDLPHVRRRTGARKTWPSP